MTMRFAVIPAFLACVCPAVAGAVTMTFDDIDDGYEVPPGRSYSEGGVLMTGDGEVAQYGATGAARLDDWGSPVASTLSFTMESPFVAKGFQIRSLGSWYVHEDTDTGEVVSLPYDNVEVSLFRGETRVFNQRFSAGEAGAVWRYLLPDTVGGVDRMSIGALWPTQTDTDYCTDAPCGTIEIDNVTLAPIPAPPAGVLLLSGMMVVWAARRRVLAG